MRFSVNCSILFTELPLLGRLAGVGYRGRVGLEYKPADPADSSTSFGWLAAAQA